MTEVNSSKAKLIAIIAAVVIVAAVLFYLASVLLFTSRLAKTDDAYIRADIARISPQIAGVLSAVLVSDNQNVKKGQLLAIIEPETYLIKLKEAQSATASAQARLADSRASLSRQQDVIASAAAARDAVLAELNFARQEQARYQRMQNDGAGSLQDFQKSTAQVRMLEASMARSQAEWRAASTMLVVLQAKCADAQAAVETAQAAQELAQVHYSWTQITAPEDGIVTGRTLRLGQYVAPGEGLLSLVPAREAYIVANFLETQLREVAPGQKVRIRVDSLAGREFSGLVDSLAPASAVSLSVLAPSNASGNFTKIVQRIPVKIVFDSPARAALSAGTLRIGMSTQVVIDTSGNRG